MRENCTSGSVAGAPGNRSPYAGHLYVFNLRGNGRTSGEQCRKEGHPLFAASGGRGGSLTPITIALLVKDPADNRSCKLYYHDIGDYLTREDKLSIIESFGSIEGIEWQMLKPNTDGDWIFQRDPAFEKFAPLGEKVVGNGNTIFGNYSLGLTTNRDPWVYNMSREVLESNIRRMTEVYNAERARYAKLCAGKPKDQWPDINSVIENDPRYISWTRSLKDDAKRNRNYPFHASSIRIGSYRPFTKQWLYFNRAFNEYVMQMPRLFPSPEHENVAISCTGVADRKGFTVLATDQLPNLHLTDTGQCFPLYWYDKPKATATDPQGEMAFEAGETPDADGYIRREAITDWALTTFRDHYQDQTISKEDLFWYVYGILHSPEYKQRFAADLRKMLPRIPFAGDFWAFSRAGRELGDWHLNYETVEPYPLTEEKRGLDITPDSFYRVTKMSFGKKEGKPDKTVIIYNPNLILRDIPLDAYGYVVNGKSAIEWIMDRYQVTVDKASGIKNDPNDWSDDPRYIVDLLRRVVRVSLESVRIVAGLPGLGT